MTFVELFAFIGLLAFSISVINSGGGGGGGWKRYNCTVFLSGIIVESLCRQCVRKGYFPTMALACSI